MHVPGSLLPVLVYLHLPRSHKKCSRKQTPPLPGAPINQLNAKAGQQITKPITARPTIADIFAKISLRAKLKTRIRLVAGHTTEQNQGV